MPNDTMTNRWAVILGTTHLVIGDWSFFGHWSLDIALRQRLEQHPRDPAQSRLGVADELLEDAVRDRHELLHVRQPLASELHVVPLRRFSADGGRVEAPLAFLDRLEDRVHL